MIDAIMRVGGEGFVLSKNADGGYHLVVDKHWLTGDELLALANRLNYELELDRCSDGMRWDEDHEYPAEDWRDEVWRGDTRRSYAQWVAARREEDR